MAQGRGSDYLPLTKEDWRNADEERSALTGRSERGLVLTFNAASGPEAIRMGAESDKLAHCREMSIIATDHLANVEG
jgi:hypothetical protein